MAKAKLLLWTDAWQGRVLFGALSIPVVLYSTGHLQTAPGLAIPGLLLGLGLIFLALTALATRTEVSDVSMTVRAVRIFGTGVSIYEFPLAKQMPRVKIVRNDGGEEGPTFILSVLAPDGLWVGVMVSPSEHEVIKAKQQITNLWRLELQQPEEPPTPHSAVP